MKRKFTFLLMALLTLAGFKSWGQETILSEGFEHDGSFPEGWTATHNNANGTGWYLAGTDYNIGSGYSGWSAFCKGSSSQGIEDYLTTYAIDFSGYMSASLSFYYTNRQWYSDINQIRVEYSSSTDGSWTTLWSNTTGTGTGYGNWIQANNINLSALCGGTYYLRFVNVDKYGYGIAIDEILITGIAGGTSYNITYDNTIQHGSISGPATAFANQTVTLTATPAENYALDHFTVDGLAIQGKTFTMPEHDVTVSATFKQVFTLTVNDGTSFADGGHRVPFRAEHASNYYTKSEFIIPLGDLEAMRGGTISSLTFYTSNYTNDYDFPNASWDVYVMEADYTLPGGPLSQDGTKFTDVASMTKVYSGPMSVKNHQMTIVLDAPIVYNSKNLIISFQQTSKSNSYVNAQWYGKNEGSAYRSRGGSYNDSNFTSAIDVASKPFLPKTTFTYMPGATYTVNLTQPEAGGTIDANPKTDVAAGTTVTLSATPATGYELGEWIVTNVTTSQPITVTNNQFTMPDSDVTVSATFAQLTQHNVNISQSIEHGTVTASPSECYSGTTVTLTAAPDPGYQYTYGNISVVDANGQSVIVNQGNPTSTFTMPNSDVTVSATFTKLYSVSMGTVQNGSAYSAQGSGVAGSTINVFVTPNTGCEVISVIANYEGGSITASFDDVYSGQYLYYFDMPAADVTVNVVCALTYTVSYTQPTGGTISVSPTTHVPASQSVSISIDHIQAHYSFDYANYASKISVKDASQEAVIVNKESDGHYYFLMPASNVTVAVTFDEDANYNIDVTQPEGCTIEVSPSENVYANETVYLSYYNVQTGYEFVEWVVKDGEETITPEYDYYYYRYYFTMPASENVSVTATVEALTAYTVNIAEGIIGGSVSAYTNNDYEAPINAYEGEIVYLTNTPETGYQFVSYTVTSECGTVEVYYDYYFNMPACDVTVSATFALAPQDLTVNDGTTTNYEVPFDTYYTFCSTKSQFIIPAEQLQSMFDGTITDLTFYINYNDNFDFGNARWNVYVKEVDYQTLNDYASTEGMTLVYNGGMAITNGQMHIDFDTDFEYNDSNLLICFEQIQAGNYLDSKPWYGVYTGKPTAYAGYDYGYGLYSYAQTFLPKTTIKYMPSANPQTRYEIAINNPEGTTINASKTMAAEGAVITLSKSLEEGYVFNNWIVMQGETPVTVENDQFEMPAGDVTVTANVTAPTYYNVYLDPSTDYTIYADPVEHILAGKTITLSDDAGVGKTVDEWAVTERTSGMPVEVTFNDDYNLYQFTMPNDDVDVTATFRDLKECTVNFYVNGVKWEEKTENVFENSYIYFDDKVLETTPAGTTFTGWKTSEIETFETEYPQNIYSQWGYFQVKDNTDFYAVFSFTEKVPTGESTWSQLTTLSQLEDGDEVIFTGYQYDESTYPDCYHVLTQRSSATATDFGKTDGMSWNDLNQGNFPEEPVVFTAVNNAGSWNFMYEDAFVEGTSALAVNSYGSMGPKSYLGGYDNWSIHSNDGTWTSGYTYNVETNNYINFDGSRFYGGEYNNAASLYRRVIQTDDHNYYMTEALGFGGADEHITANTSATNVVIAKNAKLTINNGATLNVEGICLSASHDAAQLVIADGGQLITDNAGVLATMKKHINGIEWYTISSPLAASVNVTDVTNLIPNSVTDTNYDLYRFDEKNGVWVNSRLETGANPDFTTIDKGVGYIYSNTTAADVAFAGEINVADVECNLTNGAAHGFNLIGNPFTQNITLANVTGTAELADGFYVLNNDETWGTKLTESEIKPLQGFLVQATTAGTATISKPTAAPSKGERSEQNTNIEMIVSNSIYRDNAFAMFGEGTGLNKVSHRNAQAPMLYIPQDGEDFAIAFMDESTTVFPVSFKAMTTGKYSISLKATDDINTLVLVDNMTGVETNMLLEDSYKFIGSPADNENRFTVKLKISNSQDEDEHFAYQNGNELVINGEGTLQIFDILGRVVISEEVHGQTVNVGGLNTGAYIVRLTGESVKTQKIVVR